MPMLDLSNAKDRGDAEWQALPEGTYKATIDNAEMGATKGGPNAKLPEGTPVLNIRFKVDDDDMPSDDLLPPSWEDEDGNEHTPIWSRTAFKGFPLAKKGYENKQTLDNILYGFLKAAGYDTDEIKSGKFELDVDDLPGRGVLLVIGHREWEGKIQNDVKYINPIESGSASLL